MQFMLYGINNLHPKQIQSGLNLPLYQWEREENKTKENLRRKQNQRLDLFSWLREYENLFPELQSAMSEIKTLHMNYRYIPRTVRSHITDRPSRYLVLGE